MSGSASAGMCIVQCSFRCRARADFAQSADTTSIQCLFIVFVLIINCGLIGTRDAPGRAGPGRAGPSLARARSGPGRVGKLPGQAGERNGFLQIFDEILDFLKN